MTCNEPFKEFRVFDIFRKVAREGYRPAIDEVPEPYRSLIENCWSQRPEYRLTFDEIVKELKRNADFIMDSVDEEEFLKYVDFIDMSDQSFDTKKPTLRFADFKSGSTISNVEQAQHIAPEKKRKRKSHHHHHHKKRKSSTSNESNIQTNNESNIQTNNESNIQTNNESNEDLPQIDSTFDISQYEIQRKIGEGSFGKVFKVIEKQTGQTYAAKVSKKLSKGGEEEEDDDEELLDIDLQREINNSNKFNHPTIVKFIGFSLFDFTGLKRPVIIVEYMGGGSLGSLLKKAKKGLSDPRYTDTKKLIIIYGIAAAMQFLHDHDVIHRDLKPDNILMDEDLNPKLADFGLSKTLHSNQESMSVSSKDGFKGTMIYSPPEVFNGEKSTKACDVYAFSLIVYEIMTNDRPFENCTYISLINTLMREERPPFDSEIPTAYKKLIKNCWAQDPQDRPTFAQIVNALKDVPEFITDAVDGNEFWRYVDYIDESPNSFKKTKIIPSFNEFCKEKALQKVVESDSTTQTRSASLIVKKDVESDSTTQTRSATFSAKKAQSAQSANDDNKLEELRSKEADELFETWEKMFYGKDSSSAQQKSSLNYVRVAAEKGHVTAMFSYASMLYNGIGTRINRKEASVYFKKAADEGHIESMHIYATIMSKGDAVVIDQREALDYFKKAADKGHVESMYKYAMMQYKSLGTTRNEEEAKIYCKKAADNGHINAMCSYATILSKDEKSDNLDEIKIYYRTAAENGHVKAMFHFANILLNEKNNKEAAKYLKLAADSGYIDAMYSYAELLRKSGGGYCGDVKEIPHYYKTAADNGHVDSMFCYAEILSKGNGVAVDKGESAKYYKMAADKGKKEAMLVYAEILNKGIGVPVNKKESKIYIQMAKKV